MKTIETFWNYFIDNNKIILTAQKERPQNIRTINYFMHKYLQAYCPAIEMMINLPKDPNYQATLFITAFGNPAYFDKVRTLVNHAPRLKDWKIIAFIQPILHKNNLIRETEKEFVYNDINVRLCELTFVPLSIHKLRKIDFLIYYKKYTKITDQEAFLTTINMILSGLLGEENFIYINSIYLYEPPKLHHGNTFPLYEAPTQVEKFKKTLSIY